MENQKLSSDNITSDNDEFSMDTSFNNDKSFKNVKHIFILNCFFNKENIQIMRSMINYSINSQQSDIIERNSSKVVII